MPWVIISSSKKESTDTGFSIIQCKKNEMNVQRNFCCWYAYYVGSKHPQTCPNILVDLYSVSIDTSHCCLCATFLWGKCLANTPK